MMFKAFDTRIEGVKIVTGDRHRDDRGTFEELFHAEQFGLAGLPTEWAQDNCSRSFQGVLRGLHIQRRNPQGKLVRCLTGVVWDVWVDLRLQSPTFKQWQGLQLSSERAEAVYIPPGLAHGFVCLTPYATLHYKCTTMYDKETDTGVNWRSPEIGIEWPFPHEMEPMVSPRDANLPSLGEYLEGLR